MRRPGIIGDVTGDGYADLVAMRPSGVLSHYPNNINSNPGSPFGSGFPIGTAFHVFDIVRVADLNGDGFADLVARKPDGALWYYGNNILVNPGSPFSSGLQIGTAFHIFDRISLGDVSGDGYADLVGRKPDGTLWYYPNNINSNPVKPFSSVVQIGSDFQKFDTVLLADLNSDGLADLVCRKPDGTLWWCLNVSGIFTAPIQIGTGFQIFDVIVLGDLTGNGYADLLGRKPDGTLWHYKNTGASGPYFSSGSRVGTNFDVFSKIA
jgi:hypothetical protein